MTPKDIDSSFVLVKMSFLPSKKWRESGLFNELINQRSVGMRISRLLGLGLQFSYPALESIGRRVCAIINFFGFVLIIARAEKVFANPARNKLCAKQIKSRLTEVGEKDAQN